MIRKIGGPRATKGLLNTWRILRDQYGALIIDQSLWRKKEAQGRASRPDGLLGMFGEYSTVSKKNVGQGVGLDLLRMPVLFPTMHSRVLVLFQTINSHMLLLFQTMNGRMLLLFPKMDGYRALLEEVQHRLDHKWADFETMTAFGHLAAVDRVSPLAEDDAGKIAPLD